VLITDSITKLDDIKGNPRISATQLKIDNFKIGSKPAKKSRSESDDSFDEEKNKDKNSTDDEPSEEIVSHNYINRCYLPVLQQGEWSVVQQAFDVKQQQDVILKTPCHKIIAERELQIVIELQQAPGVIKLIDTFFEKGNHAKIATI